jgi:hypothetical protein
MWRRALRCHEPGSYTAYLQQATVAYEHTPAASGQLPLRADPTCQYGAAVPSRPVTSALLLPGELARARAAFPSFYIGASASGITYRCLYLLTAGEAVAAISTCSFSLAGHNGFSPATARFLAGRRNGSCVPLQ